MLERALVYLAVALITVYYYMTFIKTCALDLLYWHTRQYSWNINTHTLILKLIVANPCECMQKAIRCSYKISLPLTFTITRSCNNSDTLAGSHQLGMPKNYFSVTLFLLWLDFALCSVYYITPSSSDPCPTTPCVTLPQITLDNLRSNTTLVFLPGDHDLNSTLHVSNIGMLVMLSSVDESVPVIHCGQGSNLTILNISDVHIVGLEFRCGGNRIVNVNQFVVENSIFYGQNSSSGTILEIVATCAYVMNSIFKFGTVGNLREYLDVLDYLQETFFGTILLSVRVGGAVIVTNSNVTIRHSHFEGNSAQIGGALFSEMNSNITVDSCTFLNNNASGCNDDRCLGGAVFVDTGCTVVIENSSVESNMALTGGGAFSTFQAMLSIRDCVIYSNIANYGGAIAVYLNSTLMIEDSQFYNNVAEFLGGVVNVVGSLSFIDSSTLYNNTAGTDGGVLASQQGSTINIENCTFVNNFVGVSGGVMVVQYDSEIIYVTACAHKM